VDKKQAVIASIILVGVAAVGLSLKYREEFLSKLNSVQSEEAIA